MRETCTHTHALSGRINLEKQKEGQLVSSWTHLRSEQFVNVGITSGLGRRSVDIFSLGSFFFALFFVAVFIRSSHAGHVVDETE